jgi:hypothetical protein
MQKAQLLFPSPPCGDGCLEWGQTETEKGEDQPAARYQAVASVERVRGGRGLTRQCPRQPIGGVPGPGRVQRALQPDKRGRTSAKALGQEFRTC